MTHRKSNPPTADWASALNLIDVVFYGHKDVIDQWHNLYIVLETTPFPHQRYNRAILELLSEMAKVVGYPSLKQTDIDKFYFPQAHGNAAAKNQEVQEEFLRVLKSSDNFGTPRPTPTQEEELPF